GLRPRADDVVEVQPLLPPGTWDWFCLDGIPYHGRQLTIVWDRDGSRYQLGPGLRVYEDGREIARAERLAPLTGHLTPLRK
ncbi:MAG TPA: glycoside hydrolase, partial [Candidatus Paceibacterota bacterium]|nr:glycoside hydrolase [Candidatus Paceibacterota bacterium]